MKNDEQLKKSTDNNSDSKNQYDYLLSYFKNLVWLVSIAIVVMTGFALYITFHDRNEMRQQMMDVVSNAEETIKRTETSTTKKLEEIKNEALQIALKEARLGIEQEFESKNIRKLIESAAKQEIGSKLEEKVNEEFKRFCRI